MIALLRPAAGNITERFGPRPKPTPTSPAIHYGVDFGWGGGLDIRAAATGRVLSAGAAGAYGNRVVISHGSGYETWYCHLEPGFHVSVGDQVTAGQLVATMGGTGNVTAVHLHFELRLNGVAIDPYPSMAVGLDFTPLEEEKMTDEQAKALAECRRMLGVLLGYNPAANDVEAKTMATRRQMASDAAECRRMLGVLLGWQAPAPGTPERLPAVLDPAKFAAELVNSGLVVTLDPARIVEALGASLSDDFDKIPQSVRDAIIK